MGPDSNNGPFELSGGFISRRNLLLLGTAMGTGLFPISRAIAGPFDKAKVAPVGSGDKRFTDGWLASLTARGEPETFTGDDLKYIGMPVGGITTGTMYLGGDGRLWLWDIFNKGSQGIDPKTIVYEGRSVSSADGSAYVSPPEQLRPVEQGFALRVKSAAGEKTFQIDRTGFENVTFAGQYPIGNITYRDPACPISLKLEAFSPFIPLNADDSSLPATVLEFKLTNDSSEAVEVTLAGWLENAVCLHSRERPGTRRNRVISEDRFTFLQCTAAGSGDDAPAKPDIVFEKWANDTYDGWKVEGAAFGKGPVQKSLAPDYQGDLGGPDDRVVNSHASSPGKDVAERDAATGKLTSWPFRIDRPYIRIWLGGGNHPGATGVNLVIDGKIVAALTGRDENLMREQTIDARPFAGKSASIEIVDAERGAWGNVGVGRITFSDHTNALVPLESLPDYGTMGLALLGPKADYATSSIGSDCFHAKAGNSSETALSEKLLGSLGRSWKIAPGKSVSATFILVWHFPNLVLPGTLRGRYYGSRFKDATEVAKYVAKHFGKLAASTRQWRDTWYDSTLPHWFLNRTFANTSTLATSTCFRLKDGRFWAWEGVGCCPGTCTHVWHYAQAMARIFPELERNRREKVDFGLAFDPNTGIVYYRGEFDKKLAIDGQCGVILSTYREHQMSEDSEFLKRTWPRVKRAMEAVIERDETRMGLLSKPMLNTLDAEWYGIVPWIVGLYHAALRAAELMALEIGDESFATECRAIFEKGLRALDKQTWREEYGYYVHVGQEKHLEEVGSYNGCHVDQVLGQSWAWQVGLGRVMDEKHTQKALGSLWRFSVMPDVGPYRKTNAAGRWYAMPGDGGLVMVTFPFGRPKSVSGPGAWSAMYFNECMSGFEWQAAGHMIWEGMVTEGLAVARLIHDRYHPRHRNPYNEIECSDHYARAMASYGAYLAACGFAYHGPKRQISFAPRLTPENFRAAFTVAAGWGSYAQTYNGHTLVASLSLKHGSVRLRTVGLELPEKAKALAVVGKIVGQAAHVSMQQTGRAILVTLDTEVRLQSGQALEVSIEFES